VAESGARLSVRDAGVGGTRACIATVVHRVCRTKAEKKVYTHIYICIYKYIYIYIYVRVYSEDARAQETPRELQTEITIHR